MTGPDLQISGGTGGTDAHYRDIATLAQHSDDLAVELASISAQCHAALTDPDVLASAVLNPQGVARFEAALLGALDGRAGLSMLAVGFGQRAVALRAAAASYQAVDAARAQALDSMRWVAGNAFAQSLPVSLPALAALGIPVAAYTLAGGEVDWQRLITDHPGVVDLVVGAGPGLISGLPLLPPVSDVPGAANLIGMFYPDGSPQVTSRGTDDSIAMTQPPVGFGDLLNGLNHRNGQDAQLDVRVITNPDGSRAYIVDIPGTRSWDFTPNTINPDINDLSTNLHALGGDVTSYERGVAEALKRAGANPDDPVMLVGHSQGGIVAADAANHFTASKEYNVTHVVTAGSPVGRIPVPDGVQVLSLENQHDLVPHLDATANPDQPNRTTVTFDSQHGTVGDNHGIGSAYQPAATALDSSTHPSVVNFKNTAQPFLAAPGGGTQVTTHQFEVSRS